MLASSIEAFILAKASSLALSVAKDTKDEINNDASSAVKVRSSDRFGKYSLNDDLSIVKASWSNLISEIELKYLSSPLI
jgi:hypothetical protein